MLLLSLDNQTYQTIGAALAVLKASSHDRDFLINFGAESSEYSRFI
jgi:hypothetical protein